MGNKCLEDMSNFYTTNTDYLKNTQEMITNIDNINFDEKIIEKTYDSWNNLKKEDYFMKNINILVGIN